MSMPVKTLWVDPKQLNIHDPRWHRVLKLLNLNPQYWDQRMVKHATQRFLYLKRQIQPAVAQKVLALKLPGVHAQPAYRRFYPQGESTTPLTGFTSVDGIGQEGIEKHYQNWLAGEAGKQAITRDLKGHIFFAHQLQAPEPGQSIALSIDYRMQYLVYRALKTAVVKHQAISASAVLLNVKTGEVLAMASFPAFNANQRADIDAASAKNRAVTDVFEPGSVIKPLAMVAVLDSGLIPENTQIDTAPGRWRIGRHIVRDTRNYGMLNLEGIIQK